MDIQLIHGEFGFVRTVSDADGGVGTTIGTAIGELSSLCGLLWAIFNSLCPRWRNANAQCDGQSQ